MISEREMKRAEEILTKNLHNLAVMLPEEYALELLVETNRDEVGGLITVQIDVNDGDLLLGLLRMNSRDCEVEARVYFASLSDSIGYDALPPEVAKELLNKYMAVAEALPGMQKRLQVILQDNEWPMECPDGDSNAVD